jgi:excisionase family DNA binding protein
VSSALKGSPVPRLALRPSEAAEALGFSADYFREHVDSELRWVRRGRSRVVPVAEVEAWLERSAERALPEEAHR